MAAKKAPDTMRVKMNETAAGPGVHMRVGEQYEVETKYAKRLIEAGLAQPVRGLTGDRAVANPAERAEAERALARAEEAEKKVGKLEGELAKSGEAVEGLLARVEELEKAQAAAGGGK